jgi:hypothetical protein
MGEREQKSGGPGVAILCGIVLFLVPVLYVLSTGPVAWLANGNPSLRWVDTIYYPLGMLAKHCEPFRDSFEWYVRLWV